MCPAERPVRLDRQAAVVAAQPAAYVSCFAEIPQRPIDYKRVDPGLSPQLVAGRRP